jgi:hypothetical protein
MFVPANFEKESLLIFEQEAKLDISNIDILKPLKNTDYTLPSSGLYLSFFLF